MATAHERILQADDGTALFVADWPSAPISKVHGGIVLMHGLGEHCGRYAHVAHFFNDCGWSVRAYDHRGHGRSGGARGDVPAGDAILRDAKTVIDDFARQFDAPPLLLGHSMGGLFAARFATSKLSPLRGLILSSPALAVPMTRVQKLLLKTMTAIAPGLGISNGLKIRYLSHDPAVVAAYAKDPLRHTKISSRLLNSMLNAIVFSHSHAATLALPTLVLIAGDDYLVDAAGSKEFFAKLAHGLGTMHVYDRLYHEIFNEVDAHCVFDDVRAWLSVHHWIAAAEPSLQ